MSKSILKLYYPSLVVLFLSCLCVLRFFSVANAQDARSVQAVKITGGDEAFDMDVELINGKRRALVDAIVVVEEIFGRDPHATNWFYIGNAEDADGLGLAGDTIRVQIPGAVTPLGVIYPAVDVTTTVTAPMVAASNPEREMALQICTDLNGDTDFINAKWKCLVIKDHSGVFIESKLFNEFGERTSWSVTATGTTVVLEAGTKFERRGLPTELSRSPNDPRQGILGISGTVTAVPGGIGDLLIENFMDVGLSSDLRINGATTPTNFVISCDAVKDRFIQEIRFYAGCNGLKFGQFLCKNSAITNGIMVTIVSEQNILVLPLIHSTEDFKNKFSFGGSGPGATFRIDVQAGGDQMTASFLLENPAVLEKCGTNPLGDDSMTILIQDRLDNVGLNEFEALARGFEKEP